MRFAGALEPLSEESGLIGLMYILNLESYLGLIENPASRVFPESKLWNEFEKPKEKDTRLFDLLVALGNKKT